MVESRKDMDRPEVRSAASLVIPCRAEYVSLGRLLVGALGARERVDEETIADMKVVVTEVCACFLTAERPPGISGGGSGTESEVSDEDGSLRLDLTLDSQSWTIVISNPDAKRRIPPSALCDPSTEGALGLTIIEALVDSVVRTDSDSEGSAFRVIKAILPVETSTE